MSLQYEIVTFHTNQNIIGFLAIHDQKTIGHVFLLICPDNKIKFFDDWVDENYRNIGIYTNLWKVRYEYVLNHFKDYTIFAWCKNTSLNTYLKNDFIPGEISTYVEKQI